MQKITPFLWFDKEAQEAAKYYVSIFKNSKITDSNPMSVSFNLDGQDFIALNAGPNFKFTEAISMFVNCEDQKEVDYFWNKFIGDGGEESMCGWLKDKYGLSWQIVPKELPALIGNPDPVKAKKALDSMLKMHKIIVADLQKAAEEK
ncbi:MAG TPA: VOC family protein [Patescibacteria group bacterium]|nr:VOC family protein [Patescibacteria group bacterium]